jgi:hypothetical protein
LRSERATLCPRCIIRRLVSRAQDRTTPDLQNHAPSRTRRGKVDDDDVDVYVRGRSGPSLRKLETVGALAVMVAGVLLHFAYDWSGGNRVVAAIAPANESVWEHLKLVLIPVLALGVEEAVWGVNLRRLWWAKLVEVVTASVFIVAFFYTYTGALGIESNVAVDILSYLVAIAGGQWLSYRLLVSERSRAPTLAVSVTALVLLVVGFGVLTFSPPHIPLFRDAPTGIYGPA